MPTFVAGLNSQLTGKNLCVHILYIYTVYTYNHIPYIKHILYIYIFPNDIYIFIYIYILSAIDMILPGKKSHGHPNGQHHLPQLSGIAVNDLGGPFAVMDVSWAMGHGHWETHQDTCQIYHNMCVQSGRGLNSTPMKFPYNRG